MTKDELLNRAHLYVRQAQERLDTVETGVTIATDATGAWVSLRANLKSALADLDTLTKGA